MTILSTRLAACTPMMVRLFADRKGLAAKRSSVRLSHRRTPR
jgi:hypothetical protein